jgi:hypothetical protein
MLDRVKGLVIATVIAIGSITSSLVFVTYAHAESPKHTYDAVVVCKTPVQEDQLIDAKLVQFERAPEGLVIVFRCDGKY